MLSHFGLVGYASVPCIAVGVSRCLYLVVAVIFGAALTGVAEACSVNHACVVTLPQCPPFVLL